MLKTSRLLFLLLFVSYYTEGQIIDNSNCHAFSDEPFFSKTFIKNNNIKRIIGRTSSKKEMDVIRKQEEVFIYDFNDEGDQTAMYWSYRMGQNTIDTSAIIFIYDDKGRITTKRRNDNHSFYSYSYNYNDKDQVIYQRYSRDENAGNSTTDFKQGDQYVIVSDSFEYHVLNDTQYVKKYFNNHGKIYQQTTITKNSLGYLLSESTRMVISRKTIKTHYTYNDRGLASERSEVSTVMGKSKIAHKYRYDDFGNLLEENIYRNDKHTTEKQIVYDKKTMLLRSLLVRKAGSNIINLIQFEYEFHEPKDSVRN